MLFGQVQAFIEVARTGNVSRAAEALYVTQPALTARIQALEKELGEALFVRTGRGVRLTDAGRVFLPNAERAVQAVEDGRQALSDRTSSYFELTQSLFLRGGVVAHTVMELDNIEAAKKMVEEGLGVALLPRVSVAREVSSGLLSEIEVLDAPPVRRSVDAIRRKDAGTPGGVVHAFLQELETGLKLRERRSVQLVV